MWALATTSEKGKIMSCYGLNPMFRKRNANHYNGTRESIDFFRFDCAYEDVFVTESGELLYCSADMLGCPTMTASRLYAIDVHAWDEFLDTEEIMWACSKEQTQADIAWLYGLDRAPEDVAAQVIACEYAFGRLSEDHTELYNALAADEMRNTDTYQKALDTFSGYYEEALKATELGRAAFTYQLPIAC